MRDNKPTNSTFVIFIFTSQRWEQTAIAADWPIKSTGSSTIDPFSDGGLPGIGPVDWDIVAPMGVRSSPPRKSHRNIFAGNAKDRLHSLRLLVDSSDARLDEWL